VWFGELWRRLVSLVRGRQTDEDLRREMQAHLESLAEDARENGEDAQASLDAARRRFGNELALREACREAAGWAGLDRLVQDVRLSIRSLRRDWRLTGVALFVLALGIGGNTVVFGLANAILFNPYPYPQADRLVEITWRSPAGRRWDSTVRVADFGYWRDHAAAYESLAAYGWLQATFTGQSLPGFPGAERIVAGRVTEGFLRVLHVQPAAGRFFSPAEDRPGGPEVVVLSHRAWVQRFGGRREVLGETLTLDGVPRTIVGVMPASLPLPGMFTCEVWLPAAFDVAGNMRVGYDTQFGGDHAIARLKPGVTVAGAQAELHVMVGAVERVLHRTPGAWKARVEPLRLDLGKSESAALRLIALVVGIALLLACANLAGLLLARGTARSHEWAIRVSLGAGRLRLVRQALTESLVLSLGGGVLGLALARWGVAAIGQAAPAYLGLDSALRLDGAVLLFTLGLTLATGIAFGLIPALHASRTQPAAVLKGAGTGGRTGGPGRLLSILVVAEVSLALLLLVGGGLAARSVARLMAVDTGIRPANLLTLRISLAGAKYDDEARRLQFFGALLQRCRHIPGVTAAAAVNPLPMSREYQGNSFRIEDRPAPSNPRDMMAQFCQATAGYFRTVGAPVVLGSEFEDANAQPGRVLVNEAFARAYFPGESPIGHALTRLGTIVGVVGDIRHNGPGEAAGPQIYFPLSSRAPRTLSLVLRTTQPPASLAGPVRREIRALDAEVPLERLKPMDDVVGEFVASQRVAAGLVGGFALFALALAAIGLYGVVAYSVSRRQREIGVRVALGATRREILALVLSRGARLALAGIAIGLPITIIAARLAASALYGLDPADLLVFTAVPLVLLAVSLVASFLPARAATRIDPLAAIRAE
jgi:putative ABC transport system permease protein